MTIKQHFETLPEPIRSKALANVEPLIQDRTENSLADALINGFMWWTSKEGWEYWDQVHINHS